MSDSMFDTEEVVYARTSEGDCTRHLKLTGREELNYYIKINKAGKVVEYYTSDGTYQYSYSGTGLNIEDIDNAVQIATASASDVIAITCSGVSGGVSDGNTSSNTPTYLYSNASYSLGDTLEVNGTTVFDNFDPAIFNNTPFTNAFKVDESNHITEIYAAFKLGDCDWSNELQSCIYSGDVIYIKANDPDVYSNNKTIVETALGEYADCHYENEGSAYEAYFCSSLMNSALGIRFNKLGSITINFATNFCTLGNSTICGNYGYDG